MANSNIWSEEYAIRSYEVDARGNLSILSICNFMQHSAGRHAHSLGVSVQQLLSQNFTWVLSRLIVKLAHYPGLGDKILLETWPSGGQRLFALRDFQLTDPENKIFALAVSGWLVIDSRSGKIMRVEPFIDKLNPVLGEHVLSETLDKLPTMDQHEFERPFTVRYRDLDQNQHVNNVSYIEWIVESIPAVVQNTCSLSELRINFLDEAFLGDRVISRGHSIVDLENQFAHSIVREETGKEIVRAQTVWQPLENK